MACQIVNEQNYDEEEEEVEKKTEKKCGEIDIWWIVDRIRYKSCKNTALD